MNPWWDPEMGGWIGGIGGSAVGLLGAAMGVFAPRGRFKAAIVGAQAAAAGLGVVALGAGVVAALGGQPYAVYYPLLLLGGLTAGLCGGMLPMTLARYRQAEQRKLEAEEIRRG